MTILCLQKIKIKQVNKIYSIGILESFPKRKHYSDKHAIHSRIINVDYKEKYNIPNIERLAIVS